MAVFTFTHSTGIVKSLAVAGLLTTLCGTVSADEPGSPLMAATQYCLNDQLRNSHSPDADHLLEWQKTVDSVFEICDVRRSERDDARAYVAYITNAHTRGLTIIEAPPARRLASLDPAAALAADKAEARSHHWNPPETPLCIAPNRWTRDGCQHR